MDFCILQGLDGAVVLSTSVQLADELRLASAVELLKTRQRKDEANPAVGRVMIVKAHLGRTVGDQSVPLGSR